MKAIVQVPTEVNVTTVHVCIPIEYGEEDMPLDFPLRRDGFWQAFIDIDTGTIRNWPTQDKPLEFCIKVRDSGRYALLDETGREIAKIIQDYVPNRLIPGEYGDYVELKIDPAGKITNWPRDPDISEFFPEDED